MSKILHIYPRNKRDNKQINIMKRGWGGWVKKFLHQPNHLVTPSLDQKTMALKLNAGDEPMVATLSNQNKPTEHSNGHKTALHKINHGSQEGPIYWCG